MIVDDLRRTTVDGLCEISARVRSDAGEMPRLYYRFPEEYAPERLDGSPFLAGLLVWAMRAREDLTLDAPVSPRLLEGLDGIFGVYESFFPGEMRPVSVTAPAGEPPRPVPLTGSFFTRGADSWYAVLAALEDDPQTPPLTHLVFCPDFLPVDRWPRGLVEAKTRGTREAGELTGCSVVDVYTNQKREFRGHQLVAMALALGFERMLIPSGGMRGELRPRATHPDLDPRFSTERTRIVHYGDASRMQKLARIARSEPAMATLHVCRYNQSEDDVNCGRCEKCVRTMLQLHTLGALERCPAFREPLDHRRVATMTKEIKHPHQWVDILHALGDSPEDRRLAAAVRLVIARAELRNAYEQVQKYSGDPELASVRADFPDAVDTAYRTVRLVHRGLDPEGAPQSPVRRRLMVGAVRRGVRPR
jgi:hypothetical protein